MTIIMLLLTILFWGLAPIFDKAALKNGDPLLGTMVRCIAIGIIMTAALFVSGKTKEISALPTRSLVFFAVSGILAGALGTLTYYKALQSGATSRIVPLASTYPLVTAAFSILLLGESVTFVRFIGVALIVAGIWLVK